MQTLGIKSLQTNPALLTRSLESGEDSLITKRGEPIGIENGDLSLGELSSSLGQTRQETLNTLGQLNMTTADYALNDELATLERLGV